MREKIEILQGAKIIICKIVDLKLSTSTDIWKIENESNPLSFHYKYPIHTHRHFVAFFTAKKYVFTFSFTPQNWSVVMGKRTIDLSNRNTRRIELQRETWKQTSKFVNKQWLNKKNEFTILKLVLQRFWL